MDPVDTEALNLFYLFSLGDQADSPWETSLFDLVGSILHDLRIYHSFPSVNLKCSAFQIQGQRSPLRGRLWRPNMRPAPPVPAARGLSPQRGRLPTWPHRTEQGILHPHAPWDTDICLLLSVADSISFSSCRFPLSETAFQDIDNEVDRSHVVFLPQ